MNKDPLFLVIDLFCGFGGTTLGFMKSKLAYVMACVNHDPLAIESHWLNHPDVEHFEEDIRTLELTKLIRLVNIYRAFYPNAKVILWASLECTNHSKAKGGLSRDADSRTLADHLPRYIKALDPDYVQIENVVEFKIWGPLEIKTITSEEGYKSSAIEIKPDKIKVSTIKTRKVREIKGPLTVRPVWVPIKSRMAEDFNRSSKSNSKKSAQLERSHGGP
jgi:site-specific DNA-cytosine methylase